MENQKKILIIEDDPHVLKLCAHILLKEGFEVSQASTAAEALQKLGQGRPDLLIVDLMLPDMNGGEIIQQARKKYACQAPAIFLTGMITKKEEESSSIYLKVENENYPAIAKPFDQIQFIDIVKKQFQKRNKYARRFFKKNPIFFKLIYKLFYRNYL